MENNKSSENQETKQENQNQKPKNQSKKTITVNKWYLIVGLCAVIIIGLVGYILAGQDKKESAPETTKPQEAVKPIFGDTLKIDMVNKNNEEYEGEYEMFSKCYVIANSAYLRNSPEIRQDNTIELLKFGAALYAKNFYNDSGTQFLEVYTSKPESEETDLPRYYIAASTLVGEYEFDKFKKSFSLAPFSQLDSKTKKLILDNDYYNSISFAPSQNASRAAKCVAYGDFDNDGLTDTAVMLDNTEKQYSRLLVICTNKATKEPYLAYSENMSDYYMIRSFKKGDRIYKNSSALIPSTTAGLIYYTPSYTHALIWSSDNKKFISYNQESQGEEGDY